VLADELATVLVANGIAPVIYIGTGAIIPDGDGPYVVVVETSGAGAEFVQDVAGASMVMPGAQISIRAADPSVAQDTAWAAWAVLIPIRNQTIGVTWYRQVRVMQTPFDMGHDATGRRVKFGFNVVGDKKPS